MAMEQSTFFQVPVFSSYVHELTIKLQDINHMEKEEIGILFAKLTKEVNERKISLQQEMDHLNNMQESMDHMHKQFTLSYPILVECDNQSEEPWNFDSTGVPFQCVQCTEKRRIWYETCHQKTELTCGACKQCAFCTPKWRECWEGKHLAKKTWKAKLTKMVTSPEMQDVFKIEGATKRTSFKIRKAIYLQRCFESAPVTVQVADSLSSLRERKCVTQLAHDAYTQDGIPNPITPQQIEELNALNDILFADDKTNRRVRPMQLEMITQEDNAWSLKHTRIYLKKLLDVLVPNNGNAALDYILQENTLRHTTRHYNVGNQLLDNMARLYGQTQNPDVKDLMLLLMCGVLTKKELNTRITKALITNGDNTSWKPIKTKKFKRTSTLTYNVCPYFLR
jgi:hypothetical protein